MTRCKCRNVFAVYFAPNPFVTFYHIAKFWTRPKHSCDYFYYCQKIKRKSSIFMPPHRKIGGILFYRCLSVYTNLKWKLNVFPITPKLIYLQGSYLVWRHISSICICWYQGQGHLQRSRSNIKVTFLKQWPFWGHSCFTNTSCFFFRECFEKPSGWR